MQACFNKLFFIAAYCETGGWCCCSLQHATRTALSTAHSHDVSHSARTVTVYPESSVGVNAGLRQWQSTEEHAVECWPQSVYFCDTAVTSQRDPLTDNFSIISTTLTRLHVQLSRV